MFNLWTDKTIHANSCKNCTINLKKNNLYRCHDKWSKIGRLIWFMPAHFIQSFHMLYQHFVCPDTSKQAGPPTIILPNAKILVVQGAFCPSRKPKAPRTLYQNGVLPGHFFGIKMQQWSRILSSFLSVFGSFSSQSSTLSQKNVWKNLKLPKFDK